MTPPSAAGRVWEMEPSESLPESVPEPRKSFSAARLQALFEILLMSGLLSSFVASLPFVAGKHSREALLTSVRYVTGFVMLEAAITLMLLALLMKVHGEKLSDLGLRWDRWRTQLAVGIFVVPLLFFLNGAVGALFRFCLPRFFTEHNPLLEIIHTPSDLALFILAVLAAGGVKEELQRAFIIIRFRDHLGGAWLGLALWSIVFGAGHYVQGVQGVAVAALFGFVFGSIYILGGRLIAPMVSHGVYDTVALLTYWVLRK